MNKSTDKKLKIYDLWQVFLLVAIPMICVAGASLVPYKLRVPLIYITGIGSVIMFIFGGKKIKLNAVNVSMFLFLVFLCIQTLYSYDIASTLRLLSIYACAFTMLFIDIPENTLQKIITVMFAFCLIIAFSIIISVPIHNCMVTYFNFIVNPNNTPSVHQALLKELSIGSYSGFAREKGEAAFIMNIGLAISFSRFFANGKLQIKNTFALVILIGALILTGKRTMFVIPFICFAVFMIVSKIKGKAFKISCVVLVALFALFFILMFMPEFANIFYRFTDTENLETLGSRNSLWIYMSMMISQFWLFGAGFGSYNNFAYDNGLRVYGEKWNYNGHNSYYQGFAELGVVGFMLLMAFMVSALFITIKNIRSNKFAEPQKRILFFAFYIQLMLTVYAVTGNPLYTNQMIFTLFFATGAVLCVCKNPTYKAVNLSVGA